MNGNTAQEDRPQEQAPGPPLPVPPAPVVPVIDNTELRLMHSRMLTMQGDIERLKHQHGEPITTGKILLLSSGAIISVAAISIFSNWAWKKAFPGMPEERTNTRRNTASSSV